MSANASRLAVLAARISELTAIVDKYHIETNTTHPSFEESYWKETSYPENIEQARIDLSDACRELDELVTGPRMLLQNKTYPRHNYIDVVYNFDIANRVPKDGKISYTELAADIGVAEKPLRRLLRYAITNRIFREDEPGFIAHSAASRVLAEEQPMLDWLGVVLLGIGPAADYHAAALKQWPQADEPAHAPVILAKGITEPGYFAHISKTPDAARVLAGSMTLYLTDPGYSLNYLVNYYPWEEIGSGTVVDLGGSVGDTAFALANKFPQLNIIVQDQPRTIESARERPGVNVKFMVHDFFKEQPVKGADVYLCRWCLHNWPDKYAIRVLKALVPALKPGARILIMDGLVPPLGTTSNIEERALRGMDCGMMAVFNAGERELEEWRDLFASADSRYAFAGAKQPKGSKMALIEATWEPDRVNNSVNQ